VNAEGCAGELLDSIPEIRKEGAETMRKAFRRQARSLMSCLWVLPVVVCLVSLTAGTALAGDLGIKQLRVPKKVRDCTKPVRIVVKAKNYGSEDARGKVTLQGLCDNSWRLMLRTRRGGTQTIEVMVPPPAGPGTVLWTAGVMMVDVLGDPIPGDENPSNDVKSVATEFLCTW